jgi:L-fuculokinase
MERSGQFAETVDEDGFACEDLNLLIRWVEETLDEIISISSFSLKAVNFSTYGASFVHIDREGRPLTPLYNYLKPFPEELKKKFYGSYGGEILFSMLSASPSLGNLNSGLQLYRLKEQQPELFQKIKYCLHLPQFMSYLVTGRAYSDITSIGCHTGLWNFPDNHYHEWIYREGIAEKLAPIFPSDQAMHTHRSGHAFLAGVGLHDSSAALIPYLASFTEPFVLISTGTWCISLNPFNQSRLTAAELEQDCLSYMEYRGKPIKASRLFSGYEHEKQVKLMAAHYTIAEDFYKEVKLDTELISKLQTLHQPLNKKPGFDGSSVAGRRSFDDFADYKEAYHQFLIDLMKLQVESTNLILHNCPVKRIYVDGGFSRNAIWMYLLASAYPSMEVYAASVAQASAIGSALAIHNSWNKTKPPPDLIKLKLFSTTDRVTL